MRIKSNRFDAVKIRDRYKNLKIYLRLMSSAVHHWNIHRLLGFLSEATCSLVMFLSFHGTINFSQINRNNTSHTVDEKGDTRVGTVNIKLNRRNKQLHTSNCATHKQTPSARERIHLDFFFKFQPSELSFSL